MSVPTPTEIFVPISAPAVVDSLPAAIPWHPESSEAIFSTLGYHQDKATVADDLRNQAICLITALEASLNILLFSMDSPRQLIVPEFTRAIPILVTVTIIPECGLTLRLYHHPEHGIFSLPGAAFWVEKYNPYHPRTPLTSTILPFDPVPGSAPTYVSVYADIPWPQVDKVRFFNVICWYIPQRYVLIDSEYVEE